LLDEPFSSVDRSTRDKLSVELAQLKQELAVPIVMVTHDLNEALLLADRITLLDQGRTLESGSPDAVMARPSSEIAARMVGIGNILDGEVLRHEAEEGMCWIRSGNLQIAIQCVAPPPMGSRVRWIVPNEAVRLPGIRYSTLSPSRNRCRIELRSIVPLGEQARIIAELLEAGGSLELQVPFRLIRALQLSPGMTVEVTLREERLHMLPNETAEPSSCQLLT
jgi:molybdate transport system ATP-binding protein